MENPPHSRPHAAGSGNSPGALSVAVTANEMPKGPKQQPPEPEWIGDGETTGPAGEEAVRQGGKERERDGVKRRE